MVKMAADGVSKRVVKGLTRRHRETTFEKIIASKQKFKQKVLGLCCDVMIIKLLGPNWVLARRRESREPNLFKIPVYQINYV